LHRKNPFYMLRFMLTKVDGSNELMAYLEDNIYYLLKEDDVFYRDLYFEVRTMLLSY